MKCHLEKDCHKENNRKQMGLKGMLKMSACCWGPMLAFFALSAIGISASGLLLLVCPLMIIYMIWMMGKKQKPYSVVAICRFISFFLFALLFATIEAKASQQTPFLNAQIPAVKYAVTGPELQSAKGLFTIKVRIPKDHHAYLDNGDKGLFIPLNFDFSGVESAGYKISPVSKPAGIYNDEVNATVLREVGEFKFSIHRVKGREFIIPPIKATSQICNDITKICFFPNTDDIPIVIKEK